MIIIPARLKSTRFPNKVLIPIGGIPMVIRVAKIAQEVDRVVVATDEEAVREVCKDYGFEAILTAKNQLFINLSSNFLVHFPPHFARPQSRPDYTPPPDNPA